MPFEFPRLRPRRPFPALALAAFALAAFAPPAARALPPDFVVEDAAGGDVFDGPTAIAFIHADRFLVAEQSGVVWVVDHGVRHPVPVIDLSDKVLGAGDRGLLGLAVDPAFATNRRVYLMYTVDPDSDGVDTDDDAYSRLERYEMSAADSNAIDPATRVVLFGRTWAEGPASGSSTHTIGALRWGEDGSLLATSGDGGQYAGVDEGGRDPDLFLPGRIDPSEDVGAFRAQMIGSLNGKLLRLNPNDGGGYASNPFWDGDPFSKRSRVWLYGLRNPFRFALRPGTGSPDAAAGDPGTLYIGDVGWETWEEMDVAPAGGMNFGWPCYEGFHDNGAYQGASPAHHDCSTIGTPANPAPATAPLADWNHGNGDLSTPPGYYGQAATGGVFYDGTGYPPPYRGAFFYGDFGGSWIRVLHTTAADALLGTEEFDPEANGPVDFALEPRTRDIHYIAVFLGQIKRIRYTGTVSAPAPAAAAGPALSRATPNPSRGAVSFTLELPAAARVRFAIHDAQGRTVWRSEERDSGAGRWTIGWSGLTADGKPAPAGLYFARVTAGGATVTRRFARLD